MNAMTVRNASGRLVAFGPDNGMYDPGVPMGCVKAVEPDYDAVFAEWQAQQVSPPDWAGFQRTCFTEVFAGDSALVSQLIDRYPSFLLGIQTKNLGIVQAAVDRALADHTLNPTTGIPQLTADAIHTAITTYHLEGA